MNSNVTSFAETGMLIRKPVSEVFRAFTDPAVTTKFWFTSGSGKLVEGASIIWKWEMYNVSIPVHVLEIIPEEKIVIQWGDDKEVTVEWNFKEIDQGYTFVSVKNTGLKGSCEEVIAQVRDSTGGFSLMIAGLKAYLEHGIQLHLVRDRFPQM